LRATPRTLKRVSTQTANQLATWMFFN